MEFLLRSLGSGSLLTPLSKHQVFIRILICSVHVILLDGGCFQKVSQTGWFPRLLGLRFEMESCLR